VPVAPSAWSPFRHRLFAAMRGAQFVSNIGSIGLAAVTLTDPDHPVTVTRRLTPAAQQGGAIPPGPCAMADARYAVMRYKRAVEKLQILAAACERAKIFWFDTEPFLMAVYAFGEVVDGADPLDAVQVAVAINLPPEEVPWEWDHDWRREHRGYGRYPENDLWDAVEGYLDLLDASRSSDPDA
jgi:hypothetical protein